MDLSSKTPEKVKVSQEASWSCLKQRCLKLWINALKHEKLYPKRDQRRFQSQDAAPSRRGLGGARPQYRHGKRSAQPEAEGFGVRGLWALESRSLDHQSL